MIVPKAAGGVAAFTFQQLCGSAKGAADYLAIASSFHTVFISDIPRLTRIHSELVTTLYSSRFFLLANHSSASSPRLILMSLSQSAIDVGTS